MASVGSVGGLVSHSVGEVWRTIATMWLVAETSDDDGGSSGSGDDDDDVDVDDDDEQRRERRRGPRFRSRMGVRFQLLDGLL